MKLIILGLWILLLLKAFLSLPFWGYQYWKGRIPSSADVQVRIWPIIAGIALFITAFLMIMVEALPGASIISTFLMLSTIPFFAASVYSAIVVFKFRNESIKRSVFIPAAVLSILHTVIAFNLLWNRLTDLMSWA